MGLDPRVDLLVSALDLKLVQLLRQAMRGQDTAPHRRAGDVGSMPPGPRQRMHPQPHIEPRQRITPTPQFEPRPVLQPQLPDLPATPNPPAPATLPGRRPFPLPPWRIMPWENPPQPELKVKVIIQRPDIVHKGSLIDLFV